jgi:hypothetical protein
MKSWKWNHLKNLVTSLSNHEKRYLSIQLLNEDGKATNSIGTIYENIKNNTAIDEHIFKHLLPGKNISLEKSYFAKSMLKNLRNYHENGSIEITLHHALCDIEIIFSKQLYEFCLEYTSFYAEMSYHYQFYELTIQLLKWERKCLSRIDKKNKVISRIAELSKKEKDCFHQLSIIYNLKTIQQSILQIINAKGSYFLKQDKAHCLQLIQNINVDISEVDSLMGKALYYEIKSWIAYYVHNDHPGALHYNTINYNLFKDSKYLISAYPQMFMAVYFSFFSRSFLNKTNDVQSILSEIDELQFSKKLNIPDDVRAQSFIFTSEARLLINIDAQKYQDVINSFNQNQKYLKTHSAYIKKSNLLIQYYCVALAYFHLKQLTEALTFSKKIIDDFNETIKLDYYCYNSILNFIIHMELGNTSIYKYLNSSFKRVIKKHKLEDPEIAIYASFFELITKNRKATIEQYKETYTNLVTNSIEHPKGSYDMHFEKWFLEKAEQSKP